MKKFLLPVSILVIIMITAAVWLQLPDEKPEEGTFNGEAALKYLEYQVNLGPRTAGSEAHKKAVTYFTEELQSNSWDVAVQDTQYQGQRIQNIVATRGKGRPWTIIGAHYDSRLYADQDPVSNNRSTPVPAANDGASGAAVLLELGATLSNPDRGQIWLVFFDAEDNGSIPGWDWILGSRAFIAELKGKPDAAIIVDMIGDSDLNIYYERNSNPEINQEIWAQASEAGYGEVFIPQFRYSMLDDHTPFLQAGIPAVDIIDFDYPYWHTTQDTLDKVSANSLEAVGVTLQNWLKSIHNQ